MQPSILEEIVPLSNKQIEALQMQMKQLLETAKAAVEDTEQQSANSRNRHPEHRRRSTGGGRQTFDSSYPRDRKEYTLDRHCSTCGSELNEIENQDVHEYIDIIKENLKIIQQARHKYSCPVCEQLKEGQGPHHRKILTASAPERFIPGGLAGDSLVAGSLVDKFFYGLSVTRIAKRFRQLWVDLSEQNFSNWHLRAGAELEPVAQAIKEEILRQPAVNDDGKDKALP